jgi:RHS repeat-associated protein
MLKGDAGWFGTPTPATPIVVAALNSAAYVSYTAPPASVKPGQTFSYTVTMRNTGTSTWAAGGATPHRLGLVSPFAFGPARVELLTAVGPGQEGTFVVSTTVPANASPALCNFQWQMVQDGVEFFGAVTPVIATTVEAVNDAAFIAQSPPPTTLKPGQTYSFSVTMKNTGNSVWIGGNSAPHRLASVGSGIFGTNRIELPGPVLPGSNGVFTLSTTVPMTLTPGQHAFQWRMVQDSVGYFGPDTPAQTVTILPFNGAEFVSHVPPVSPIIAGQPFSYSITMRNSGTTTWAAGSSHFLGALNPQLNAKWGTDRILLSSPVAPGATYTFSFSGVLPATTASGTHNFQWQMLQDGVEWFGQPSTNLPVTVAQPSNGAQFVSQVTPPATLIAGQAVSYSVTMKNSGTTTWAAGSGHALGSSNPLLNTTFGTDRILLSNSVAPGATYTFAFSGVVPAGTAAGAYNFRWQMLQGVGGWFGPTSTNFPVTVTQPTNDAEVVSQIFPPATLIPGQAFSYSVTMRNKGTTTWAPGTSHFLGSVNPQLNTKWGTDRILLANSVAPGATYTFTLNGVLATSTTPGAHNFQWQMSQNGSAWFGVPTQNFVVTVPQPTNGSQFIAQTAPPATVVPGQSYSFSITMKNSGTTTWSPSTHRLTTASPFWGVQSIALASPVAPNEQRTFSFAGVLSASTQPQTASVQWQMAQDGAGVFGAVSPAATMTVARPQLPGRVEYIHTDGLGSPVARTDQQGNVISRTRYEPYGLTVAGAMPTIGFTGHMSDADTGLIYMQQRYYDPVAGRFLSIDPVITNANTGDSFNRYAYANDSPYSYVDPDGRAPVLKRVFARAIARQVVRIMTRPAAKGAAAASAAPAAAAAAPAAPAAPVTAALEARVAAVHSVLDPIAAARRTTAAVQTSSGTRVLAAGGRDLAPIQRAVAEPGEVLARKPKLHGEMTALDEVATSGESPVAIAASRPFCPQCAAAIEMSGGRLTSPTTAVWDIPWTY